MDTRQGSEIAAAGVSKTELARILECSKAMVTQHAKAGRLVYTIDGKVDAEKSIQRIDADRDPARGGRGGKSGPRRAESVMGAGKAEPAVAGESTTPLQPPAAAVPRETFEDVRRARELQTMEIRAIELAEKRGELVGVKGVIKAVSECSAGARKMLARIPDQLASRLAAETDVHRVHAMMQEAIDQVCDQIARGAAALPEQLDATKQ